MDLTVLEKGPAPRHEQGDETEEEVSYGALANLVEEGGSADVSLTEEGLPDDLSLRLEDTNLTSVQMEELKDLLRRRASAFTKRYCEPGQALTEYRGRIETGTAAPVADAPRRLGPKEREHVIKTVKELLAADVIEPASSPWSAAVVLVSKKDGGLRFAIDYRRLNAVTEGDAYALPRIDDTLSALNGSRYFSTFDLNQGFWNILLEAASKVKTAFMTPIGQYQWKRLPFGLKNAPAIFQRYMDLVLAGVKWHYALVFVDDIIVYSKTWEEHKQHLDLVLQRIQAFGLQLKGKKCHFCKPRVLYLGFIVDARGISPNPEKVAAIQAFEPPKTVSQLRSFLGLVGHYRRFVPDFARVARPLTQLLRKDIVIPSPLEESARMAFEKLKAALLSSRLHTLSTLGCEGWGRDRLRKDAVRHARSLAPERDDA